MSPSPLHLAGYVDLPTHRGKGAFDHAAVHAASGHVYVAHTANDAVDVFDPVARKFLYSIPDLPAVAGALVSDEGQLIISSNRGADTIGVFAPGQNPARHEIAVAGSTRWTIFDASAELFYVNICESAEIVVVDPRQPDRIARTFAIPQAGPHGLDFDAATNRLFCACDSGVLVTLDAGSGKVLSEEKLSGRPDVVFFNRQRQHLYVAVGNPGVLDVFATATMEKLATVETEPGAHTTAIAPAGDWLCAFLPHSHRAAIYEPSGA